jgi:hypothetical protein
MDNMEVKIMIINIKKNKLDDDGAKVMKNIKRRNWE